MNNFSKIFLLYILFFSLSIFPQEDNIIPGELIVQFRPEADVESFKTSLSQFEVETVQLLSRRMNIWLVKYNTFRAGSNEMLDAVRSNPAVKEAQFNHTVQLRNDITAEEILDVLPEGRSTFPNDPQFNQQWALNNTGQTGGLNDADIDAPEAWDFTTGGITSLGDTIVIAIVDGGCDLNHQDLTYWYNYAEIPGNGIDDDGNGYIDDYRGWNAYNNNGNVPSNSHGTHVSGIAGAKGNNGIGVSGVNWNVQIMPVAGSSSSEATVIAAYGYVLEMRARYNETNGAEGAFVVATNASFGVDYGQPANYPLWCAIYDSLGVQGVLSCGATANLNINIDIEGDVPTACPSPYMIAVTNTTSSDTKNSGAAYGLTTIDLGAPGTGILNTLPGNSYGSLTGTSMATPTVAGAIALMFAAANTGIMTSYKQDPAAGAIVFRDFLFAGTDPIPALNGITVTGGRLNVYNAILPLLSEPDTIAPTTITDLSTIDTTSNSLTLTWSAPLDTSQNGVMGYDIRMSTSPINDLTAFNNAQQIPFEGSPSSPGSTETLVVEGLDFNTTYYFAIRSWDLWNNVSDISNNGVGTTYGAPTASVSPDSVHMNVVSGTTANGTVTLSNISSGNSTLDYQVSLENNTFTEGSFRLIQTPVNNESGTFDESKENPLINYGQSIDGFGGPDAFGYEWIDSDEPNGPEYVWEDISTTGTEVTNWIASSTFDPKDEGYAGPFPLGFNFKFYGNTKTEVYVGTNGLILFSPITGSFYSNAAIPNASDPNEFIAPFWDDLDGRTQGTVHYKQDGNRFIIQFTNWQRYSGTGSLTFQVVLHSSGKILIYYNNMNATLNSATIGIENADASIGLQVAYNANYIHNNLALQFSAEPDWLGASPLSGTLYNGSSVDIELEFRSEDFPEGDYSMDLVISSNDPSNPTITVPVTMTIFPVPVEVASLSVETEKNSVTLKWSTASETNNQGFEVQRREVKNQNWQTVGFVEGRGNTTERQSYSFNERDLKVGKYLYRLKQIDFDGSYEYSDEIEVSVDIPQVFSLMQNYPNPFNPMTKIEYTLPEDAEVRLDVYNSLGELVTTLHNKQMEAGYQVINFDASSLPSGTYIYRITAKGKTGNFVDSKKMLLVK